MSGLCSTKKIIISSTSFNKVEEKRTPKIQQLNKYLTKLGVIFSSFENKRPAEKNEEKYETKKAKTDLSKKLSSIMKDDDHTNEVGALNLDQVTTKTEEEIDEVNTFRENLEGLEDFGSFAGTSFSEGELENVQHISEFHENTKIYSCKLCSKKSSNLALAKNHYESNHKIKMHDANIIRNAGIEVQKIEKQIREGSISLLTTKSVQSLLDYHLDLLNKLDCKYFSAQLRKKREEIQNKISVLFKKLENVL